MVCVPLSPVPSGAVGFSFHQKLHLQTNKQKKQPHEREKLAHTPFAARHRRSGESQTHVSALLSLHAHSRTLLALCLAGGEKPPRAADHLSVLPAFCPVVAQGLVRGQGAPRRPSSLASAPSPLQTTPLALSVISSSPFRQIRAFAG